jgi:hypothetical protein
MVMPVLAHMTEEASRAIGFAVLLLFLAAVTIVAFVIWGIVALVRSSGKRNDEKGDSER